MSLRTDRPSPPVGPAGVHEAARQIAELHALHGNFSLTADLIAAIDDALTGTHPPGEGPAQEDMRNTLARDVLRLLDAPEEGTDEGLQRLHDLAACRPVSI